MFLEKITLGEIMRGHFGECISHFAKQLSKKTCRQREISESLELMRSFCGISSIQTIRGWISSTNILPRGECKIKMICYLWLHGYKIIEFERLNRPVKDTSEIIGFSVMSTQSVIDQLGYAKPGSLYEIIDNKTSPSNKVVEKMREISKANREILDQRKQYCFENLRISFAENPPSEVLVENQTKNQNVDPIISIMQGLLGLLSDTENLSSKQALRHEIETISKLSSCLSDLSFKIISAKE